MELRQAMIFAKDMDRMVAFYRDGLGLRLIPETHQDGWAEFDAGGCRLALRATPAAIAATIEIASPPRRRSNTPLKLVFQTADVEAARTHLLSQGAVMSEVSGRGDCDGLDPEGNVFQIMRAVR